MLGAEAGGRASAEHPGHGPAGTRARSGHRRGGTGTGTGTGPIYLLVHHDPDILEGSTAGWAGLGWMLVIIRGQRRALDGPARPGAGAPAPPAWPPPRARPGGMT